MRVEVFTTTDEYGGDQRDQVFVDGKRVLDIQGGEPEDNCIGRDLVSGGEIAALMQTAYEACKAGEPFTLEYIALPDGQRGNPKDYLFGGKLYKSPVAEVTA